MAREELIPGTELRSSLQLPRRWPGGDTGAPIHFMSRRGALKHESSFVRVRSTSFAVVLSVHATSSSHVGCRFPADAEFETGFIDTRRPFQVVTAAFRNWVPRVRVRVSEVLGQTATALSLHIATCPCRLWGTIKGLEGSAGDREAKLAAARIDTSQRML